LLVAQKTRIIRALRDAGALTAGASAAAIEVLAQGGEAGGAPAAGPGIRKQVGGIRLSPTRAVLDASYRALGKTADELFPLRYASSVDADGETAGTLDGFMHYAAGATREIVWVR
jgi:hypothetical protein